MSGGFKPVAVFVVLFCALVSGYWVGVRHASAGANAASQTYGLNITLFGRTLHLALTLGTVGILVIFGLSFLLAISVLLTVLAYRRRRQVEAANRKLESEIKERERAENKVKELNADLERRVADRTRELEAANKELEAFSYSVSHDLRAPLRAMDGFCRALMEDHAGKLDSDGKHYLERVRAASQRMDQLVDGLLGLSRMARSEIRRTAVNLSALAEAIALELRQSDPGRRVEFVIAPALVANADANLLQIALQNLLGNAWKFTGKHWQARIEVGTMQHEGQTAYFVRDDGAGFDMAYAARLFRAFQRLHTPAQFEGTGIGLATLQRIIERHGGRIWAEAAVEKGATIYFTLGKSVESRESKAEN